MHGTISTFTRSDATQHEQSCSLANYCTHGICFLVVFDGNVYESKTERNENCTHMRLTWSTHTRHMRMAWSMFVRSFGFFSSRFCCVPFFTYSSVGCASVFGLLCIHCTCMLVFIVNRNFFPICTLFAFFLLFHQILGISIRKITEQLYHHVEMM